MMTARQNRLLTVMPAMERIIAKSRPVPFSFILLPIRARMDRTSPRMAKRGRMKERTTQTIPRMHRT